MYVTHPIKINRYATVAAPHSHSRFAIPPLTKALPKPEGRRRVAGRLEHEQLVAADAHEWRRQEEGALQACSRGRL